MLTDMLNGQTKYIVNYAEEYVGDFIYIRMDEFLHQARVFHKITFSEEELDRIAADDRCLGARELIDHEGETFRLKVLT